MEMLEGVDDASCCSWLTLMTTLLGAGTLLLLFLTRKDGYGAANYYGRFVVYIGTVSLTAIMVLPLFALRPRSVMNCFYVSKLLRHVTKLLGITWELREAEHLRSERGGVIVANHQSMLDILGMFNIWSVMGRCAAVAKKEVFYVWPFGLAAWLGGVVFIDRVQPARAHQQLSRAAELMSSGKTKLWLFPEGTRNSDIRKMLPFKKGAFRVALTCKAPIFPIVFSPYYFIDGKKKFFGKGKVVIQALPPIPTENLTLNDLDSLMERTHNIMVEAHQKLCEEVLTSPPEGYPRW